MEFCWSKCLPLSVVSNSAQKCESGFPLIKTNHAALSVKNSTFHLPQGLFAYNILGDNNIYHMSLSIISSRFYSTNLPQYGLRFLLYGNGNFLKASGSLFILDSYISSPGTQFVFTNFSSPRSLVCSLSKSPLARSQFSFVVSLTQMVFSTQQSLLFAVLHRAKRTIGYRGLHLKVGRMH